MCSNNLRSIRRKMKLSQRKLAKSLPISQSTLSRIESGQKILGTEDMLIAKMIARRLKVGVSNVFPYLAEKRIGDKE